MRNRSLILLLCSLTLPFLTFVAGPSYGQSEGLAGTPFSYGLGLRVKYIGNVAFTPDGQIDDTLFAPFVTFDVNRQGSRFNLSTAGQIEHATYLDNTFESEFRGNLFANMTYSLIDDRLNWIFQNGTTRSSINVLGVQTPDNVQQTSAFSTGPQLLLRPSAADQISLGARYNNFLADDDFDITDYDGTSGFAQWTRSLDQRTSIGVSARVDTIRFDRDVIEQPDYDRRQLALSFQRTRELSAGLQSSLTVDAGYTEASFDGAEDIDSPYFRLSWSRELTGSQSLGARLVREIGDVFADTVSFGSAIINRPVQETAVTRDPFVRNLFGLSWTTVLTPRHTLNLNLSYDDQDYNVSPLDQRLLDATIGLQWQLRPLVSLSSNLGWSDQDFSTADQQSERLDFTVAVDYQRTRNLFLQLSAGYTDETNTNANLEFDSGFVLLQLTYRR